MTTTAPPPRQSDTTPGVLARPWAGAAGLLGVASALAAGDLVAGLIDPPASPFLAVGNQFIRMTPEWLKQFAIATFGTYDKVALLGGMAVVIALAGVVAGLASRRTPAAGQAVIAVMDWSPPSPRRSRRRSVWSTWCRCSRRWPSGSACSPRPPGPAGVGAVPDADEAAGGDAGMPGSPAAGRSTLAGGALAGTALAGIVGRLLAGKSGAEASRQAVGPLPAAPQPPRIPAGADFAASGTPTFLTPNESVLPDRHRAAGAAGPHGDLVAAHPRHGRAGDHAELRAAPRAAADREADHDDVRVQRASAGT